MGCSICVTGMPEKRESIAKMVSELYGTFERTLDQKCTHLICDPITASVDRIAFANRNGIPCLKLEWLFACQEAGHLVNPNDFIIDFKGDVSVMDVEDTSLLNFEINEFCLPYLRGCNILMAGDESNPKYAPVRKMILAAGGKRESNLDSPDLTHIVVIGQEFPRYMAKKSLEVVIVYETWIIECYKAQERLAEEAFLVDLSKSSNNQALAASSTTAFKSAFSITSQKANNSFTVSQSSTQSRFSQQVSKEFYKEISKSTAVTREATFFLATSIEAQKRKKLAARAKAKNVNLSGKAKDAHFVVFPCAIGKDEDVPIGKAVIITEVLFEALLKSTEDTCFELSLSYARPVVIKKSLEACTFSQTGFTGHERAFHAAVLGAAGAKYTEALSRENTHLLCPEGPPQGDKQQYARKWGVARVTWQQLLKALSGEITLATNKSTPQERRKTISEPPPLNLQFISSQPNSSNTIVNINHTTTTTTTTNTTSTNTNNTTSNSNSNEPLFKGLVFAMSQRLHHRREALTSVIELHGGVILWSLNKHCTHYLHHGNQPEEVFREFKRAREWRVKIIHPNWIGESVAYGFRLAEESFPHTLGRTLTTTTTTTNTAIVDISSLADMSHLAPPNLPTQLPLSMPMIEPAEQQQQQRNFIQKENDFDWNAAVKERQEKASSIRLGTILDVSKFPQLNINDGDASTPTANLVIISLTGFKMEEKNHLRETIPANFVMIDAPDTWRRNETILVSGQDEPKVSLKYTAACAGGCW